MLLTILQKMGFEIEDFYDINLEKERIKNKTLDIYLSEFKIDINSKVITHNKSNSKINYNFDFEIVGILIFFEWKVKYEERLKELEDLLKNDILQSLLDEKTLNRLLNKNKIIDKSNKFFTF